MTAWRKIAGAVRWMAFAAGLVAMSAIGGARAEDSVYSQTVGGPDASPSAAGGQKAAGGRTSTDINDPHRQESGAYPTYSRNGELPGGNQMRMGDSPLGQLQQLWTNPVPAPGQVTPGIISFEVATGEDARPQMMRIRVRRYMTTTITLPPCEVIEDIYVGDTRLLRVTSPRDNIALVYPRYEGGDSNLTLVTKSQRRYYFVVIAEGVKARWAPDLAVEVNFEDNNQFCRREAESVREDERARLVDVARGAGDYAQASGIEWSQLEMHSTDFLVYAARPEDAEIAPEAIGTDGKTMFLDFGAKRARTMRWPSVYLREDGRDELVEARPIGKSGQIMQVMAYGELTLKALAGTDKVARIVCIRWSKSNRAASRVPRGVIIDDNLGR